MARAAIATKPARLANTAPEPVVARVRKTLAPPPAPIEVAETELDDTYPALMDAARSHNQAFKPPHAQEDRQIFLKRLASTVAQLTDADFEALPEEAQKWHGDAVDHINDATPLPPVPGMDEHLAAATPVKPAKAPKAAAPVAEVKRTRKVAPAPAPEPEDDADEDADPEAEDDFDVEAEDVDEEPEPVVEVKKKRELPQALRDRQQAQRDAKAATLAAASKLPAKAAKVAKPAPAPVVKTVKGVELIRRAVLDNPDVTKEEILEQLDEAGLTDTQATTVAVTMSGVLACINYLKANDRWVDPEEG